MTLKEALLHAFLVFDDDVDANMLGDSRDPLSATFMTTISKQRCSWWCVYLFCFDIFFAF